MAAKRSVLTFPGTPYMVHSVVRVGNWRGPCLTVRNAQTGATKEIGFKNNVLDVERLRAFLGNALGFVTTVYDQSGNGRHLVQATTSFQPAISAAHNVNGVVPIAIDGTPDSNLKNLKFLSVAGLSLSTQSLTCLQWTAQMGSMQVGVMWGFGDAGNVARLEQYTSGSLTSLNTPGLSTFDGVTVNRSSSLLPKQEGCMIGATGSATGLVHYLDTASVSYSAPASNTVVIEVVGNDGGTVGYNSTDFFCNIVYNTALSAGDVELVRKQMAAAFSRGPTTVQIVVDSNSNWTGYGSTGGNTYVWYLQQMMPRPVSIINMSIWGTTAANANTNFSTNIPQCRDTTKRRQIYLCEQGVNDITGGASAATAYSNAMACINAAKAAGFTHTGLVALGYDVLAPNAADYVAFNDTARAAAGTDFDFFIEGIWNDPRLAAGDIADAHLSSSGQQKSAQDAIRIIAQVVFGGT